MRNRSLTCCKTVPAPSVISSCDAACGYLTFSWICFQVERAGLEGNSAGAGALLKPVCHCSASQRDLQLVKMTEPNGDSVPESSGKRPLSLVSSVQ